MCCHYVIVQERYYLDMAIVHVQPTLNVCHCLVAKPRYFRDIVYYQSGKSPHFHISSNGTILEAEYMEVFNKKMNGYTKYLLVNYISI